jgi:anti-anti-sigma regulatory factor
LFVDATGAGAITSLLEYAQRYGVDLKLARVHSGTHRLLQVAGVMQEIGEDNNYDTVRHAVDSVTSTASTI